MVTGNGSLIPICFLSNSSLLLSFTVPLKSWDRQEDLKIMEELKHKPFSEALKVRISLAQEEKNRALVFWNFDWFLILKWWKNTFKLGSAL